MGMEIEAKMALPDFGPLREALARAGAERVGAVIETNRFFDTADDGLRSGDKGLRLRTNRDIESGRETHVITFKGANQPGAFKSREETEVTVDDAEAAASLFEKLGFERKLSFQKRRETWKQDDCKVELDEIPYLGNFVEVEGPSEAAVEAVRRKLGLSDLPPIRGSYIGMLTRHLESEGKATENIRFEG